MNLKKLALGLATTLFLFSSLQASAAECASGTSGLSGNSELAATVDNFGGIPHILQKWDLRVKIAIIAIHRPLTLTEDAGVFKAMIGSDVFKATFCNVNGDLNQMSIRLDLEKGTPSGPLLLHIRKGNTIANLTATVEGKKELSGKTVNLTATR